MATITVGNTKTFKTAADYSEKQNYIVWLGNGVATLADDPNEAAEKIMGTIVNKPQAGADANVEVAMPHGGGTAKVIAGGSISAGQRLTTNNAGKAVATTTAGDYSFGIALEDADANDVFEYEPAFSVVA